jgi:hypothetical protein
MPLALKVAEERKLLGMNSPIRILAALLLLALFEIAAASQPITKKDEEELRRQRERLHAVSMIEQTAAEAPLWNDKKSAVRVLADAADLLWDEEPGRGTRWLTKAWELLEQVPESPKDERLKEFFTRSDKTDLRTVILSVAHSHDPQLAEKFLKQLAQQESPEKKDRGAFDDRSARSEQLLAMAQQTVDSNPELAFSLAERSLVDGVSFSLQNILISLRKKNVELANRLFDLAIARFSSGQPDPSEAQVLAGYLFESGFTSAVNSTGRTILSLNPLQQNSPTVAPAEPQRAKIFLVAVYEGLMSTPVVVESPEGRRQAQQIVVLGVRLTGPYRTYAPDLAASEQAFVAQLRSQLSPEAESGASSGNSQSTTAGGGSSKRLAREELEEKRITDLEEKADRESNAAFRKVAYVQAALAVKPEDYSRAKRIAEKIDDSDLRADAISFLLYRAALFFLEKNDIQKASEIAPQISDPPRRAVVRIAIAQHLLSARTESEDRTLLEQRVLDLLNEVERDLSKQEPSPKIARIFLGRVAIMAKLDKEQTLTALQQTVQIINKLETFDLRESSAPNEGLSVSPTSGATVERPRLGFSFRNAIEPLIVTHFEQIATVADGLTAKVVRGVGRLELAKLYLRKTQTAK